MCTLLKSPRCSRLSVVSNTNDTEHMLHRHTQTLMADHHRVCTYNPRRSQIESVRHADTISTVVPYSTTVESMERRNTMTAKQLHMYDALLRVASWQHKHMQSLVQLQGLRICSTIKAACGEAHQRQSMCATLLHSGYAGPPTPQLHSPLR